MKRFYAAEEEEQVDHRSCKVAPQQKHAECSSYTALPLAPAFPMISCALSAANPPFNGGNEQYYLSAAAACFQVPSAACSMQMQLVDMQGPQQHVVGRAAYKETWLSITGQHEKALLLEKPL
ncbi:hypothetical protein GOP47_0014377 [Adiantum capillus-veneris]|uniref:Uncharacterized protein n=1 Tax=Adiantum capillus-veneris TaxID=13818 RepID=A0A9D4ULY3_ADICA|nr:hypothetical protein GOP47_0014375 [Adiantum capillus-veneris]KAI5070034.1 hypothetical protein GOP47_0014377 [Adiantum capillus-veneris]